MESPPPISLLLQNSRCPNAKTHSEVQINNSEFQINNSDFQIITMAPPQPETIASGHFRFIAPALLPGDDES